MQSIYSTVKLHISDFLTKEKIIICCSKVGPVLNLYPTGIPVQLLKEEPTLVLCFPVNIAKFLRIPFL